MGEAVVVLAHAFNRRLQVHAANEDGHDAGGVGLEGELGEIQEQARAADVVAAVQRVGGRGFLDDRFGLLHPGFVGVELLLHVAHGLGVVGDLLLVVRAEAGLERGEAFAHAVEHALTALETGHFHFHLAGFAGEEEAGEDVRGLVKRRHACAARRVRERAAVLRGEREEREARGGADVLGGEVIERDAVAKAAGSGVLGAGEEARLGRVVAANLGMGDAGEDRELVAQITEHFQILAGLVVTPGLLGEERRAIEAEVCADADHPLRRPCIGGGGEAFEPRQGQQRGAGAEEMAAGGGHGGERAHRR